MPIYFFNIHYGEAHPDNHGEELPDDKAAWHEAPLVAGEVFKDLDGKFEPGRHWELEVTNEQQKSIFVISVSGEKKQEAGRWYTPPRSKGAPNRCRGLGRKRLLSPSVF